MIFSSGSSFIICTMLFENWIEQLDKAKNVNIQEKNIE